MNVGLQYPKPSLKSRWSLVCQVRMSPWVVGESTTGRDGSLMSLMPHRMQILRLLEDCICCISQNLQFEAEKRTRVLVSFLGKGTNKVTTKQKKVTTT